MKKIIFASFISTAVLLGACFNAPKRAASPILEDNSPAREVSWLGTTRVEGSTLYSSGISGECSTLQQARQEAYNDALRKIAEYAGITISNNSVLFLNSSQSNISAFTNMTVEETALSKTVIKEFEYNKNAGGKYIGYILVQYDLKLLDEEKKRKAEIEKKKREIIDNRRKIGIMTINTPPSLYLIASDLGRFLQSEGYLIGQQGKPINVSLIDEEYIERAGGWTATLKTELNLNGTIIVTRSSGFGSDKQKAFNEAARQYINYFKDDYNKTLADY